MLPFFLGETLPRSDHDLACARPLFDDYRHIADGVQRISTVRRPGCGAIVRNLAKQRVAVAIKNDVALERYVRAGCALESLARCAN